MRYLCYKRFKGIAITGKEVNIPAMSEGDDHNTNIIYVDGKQICITTSQNGIEHFCSNDDGQGEYRGKLIIALTKWLAQPDWHNELEHIGNKKPEQFSEDDITKLNGIMDKRMEEYQAKWDKIWSDDRLKKYKRPEHADMWLWNRDYYNAPIEDLEYIANITGMNLKSIK